MKLFFVLAVATSAILLQVHGAPQITSERLGKAVQQLQQMIKAELEATDAKSTYWGGPYAKSDNHLADTEWHPRQGELSTEIQQIREALRATAQVRGVNIRNCGTAGSIINSALAVLTTLFGNEFGVLVDCQFSPGCVKVQVDVPADTNIVDINVCDRNGQACVEVNVTPTSQCIGIIPIIIPVPLPNGQQVNVRVLVDPQIPFLSPNGCVSVNVAAPRCQ